MLAGFYTVIGVTNLGNTSEGGVKVTEYFYKDDDVLPAPFKGEWELLIENIDLIMKHANIIKSRKELFYTELSFAYIASMVTQTSVLSLGALIILWQEVVFLDTCKKCGGRVYIVSAAGSPLSGRHTYSGFCSACGKMLIGSKKSYSELFIPALKIAKKYRNQTLFKRSLSCYYQGPGDIEEVITETVIREKIHSFTMEELINVLKRI